MLPDVLFLTALSVLGVAIIAFSVYVVWAGFRRASAGVGAPSSPVQFVQAMELTPTSAAVGGRAAFYLHRLSGIGVLVFLALHIVDVSLDAFPGASMPTSISCTAPPSSDCSNAASCSRSCSTR